MRFLGDLNALFDAVGPFFPAFGLPESLRELVSLDGVSYHVSGFIS